MTANAVKLLVVDGKEITQSVDLRTTKQGAASKIQAVRGGKFILAEADTGVGPENITVRRVGGDLHVSLEGTDYDQPELVIENFYGNEGELVGVAEDGEYYRYIASDAESDHAMGFLADGVASPQVLGGDKMIGFGSGLVPAAGLSWLGLGLFGLGALGLIGAAIAAGNGGGNGGGNGNKLVIGDVQDNVGDIQGSIPKGGTTDDTTPTFSGEGGTPGKIVTIIDNGKPIGSTVVGDDGKWTFTPTNPLPEGEHKIIVIEDGGLPSDEFDLIVDITAPGKATIDGALDDFGPSTGPIANGDRTDDNTPTLSGKAEAHSTVSIYDNGKLIGTTTADKDGNWTFTPDPALPDGKHSFTSTATDKAGNIGLPSDPYIIDIDTGNPVKPGFGTGIETVIDDFGPITGEIPNDGRTDDNTPTFGGGGLKPGDTVTIIDNGTEIGTAIVGGDGRWEFTPNPALPDGKHEVVIVVTDPNGNTSDPSPPHTVTIDTEAPDRPVIAEVFDSNGVPIAPGDRTNEDRPTIKGSAEPHSTVTIYNNGVKIGETTTDKDGQWEFRPDTPLMNDSHEFTAEATDKAGNTGDPSNAWDLIVDTIAPAPPTSINVDDGNIVVGFDNTDAKVGDRIILDIDGMEVVLPPLTEADILAGEVRFPFPVDTTVAPDKIAAAIVDAASNLSPYREVEMEITPFGESFNSMLGAFDMQRAGDTATSPDGFTFTSIRATTGSMYQGIVPVRVEGSAVGPTSQALHINGEVRIDLPPGMSSNKFSCQAADITGPEVMTLKFYDQDGKLVYESDYGNEGEVVTTITVEMPPGISFVYMTASLNEIPFSYQFLDDLSFEMISYKDNGIIGSTPIDAESNDPVGVSDNVFYVGEGEEDSFEAHGDEQTNILKLTGADQVLDFSQLGDRISSVEVVDLTGTGNNMLKLSLNDVLEQGSKGMFINDDSTQMMVKGDAGDKVDLAGLLGDWANQGAVTVGGVVYDVYQNGSLNIELLVQQGVETSFA